MSDLSFLDALKREAFVGHDGSRRLSVHPGEGEWVCAACDVVVIGRVRPRRCTQCRSDHIETLTPVLMRRTP